MVPVCHAQLRHGTSAEALRQNAGIGHGALAEEHNNGFSAHLASGRGKSPIEQMEQAQIRLDQILGGTEAEAVRSLCPAGEFSSTVLFHTAAGLLTGSASIAVRYRLRAKIEVLHADPGLLQGEGQPAEALLRPPRTPLSAIDQQHLHLCIPPGGKRVRETGPSLFSRMPLLPPAASTREILSALSKLWFCKR